MRTGKILMAAMLVLACVLFTACGAPSLFASAESKVTELSGVMTAEDIAALDQYENLAYLDLSGSTCYDAIMSYIKAHPSVEVVYTVDVAGSTLDMDTEEIGFINAANYKSLFLWANICSSSIPSP